MDLEIRSLKDIKGKSLDFRVEQVFSPTDLGGDRIEFRDPVVVQGTATNVESGILIDAGIKTTIVVSCDRCLNSVAVPVDIRATEEYVISRNVELEKDGEEETDFRIYKGNTINLRDMVEENILLSVPMKILCSETCKGICSACGIDLNLEECHCSRQDVDPRLEKFRGWFEE